MLQFSSLHAVTTRSVTKTGTCTPGGTTRIKVRVETQHSGSTALRTTINYLYYIFYFRWKKEMVYLFMTINVNK